MIKCYLLIRWTLCQLDWLIGDTRSSATTWCCCIGILIFPSYSTALSDIVKRSWYPSAIAAAWCSINTIDKLLFRNVSSISGFLPITILYCCNRRKSPGWDALTLVSYCFNSSLCSQIKSCWKTLQRSTNSFNVGSLILRWRGKLVFSYWA